MQDSNPLPLSEQFEAVPVSHHNFKELYRLYNEGSIFPLANTSPTMEYHIS